MAGRRVLPHRVRVSPCAGMAAGVLVAAALAGCGRPDAATQWEPAAVRAIARHAAAAHPAHRVVVLATVGGTAGAELPWGVRQALTTGGLEVSDTTALRDPAVVLLVLDSSRRDNGDWLIAGRLLRTHDDAVATMPRAPASQWRVRCDEAVCEVVDPGETMPAAERDP